MDVALIPTGGHGGSVPKAAACPRAKCASCGWVTGGG